MAVNIKNNQSEDTILICPGCRRIKTLNGNWKEPKSEIRDIIAYNIEYALCSRCQK